MEEFNIESLNSLIILREEKKIDAKTFITKLLEFEKKLPTESARFQVYYALGLTYLNDTTLDLNLAEKYLLKSLNDFPHSKISNELWKIYFNLGHLYARKSQSDKSREFFEKYILYSDDKSTLNIMGLNLYSFRSVNKFTISDLLNNEITLSAPETFNDPYDTLLYPFLQYRNKVINKESNYNIDSYIEAYKPIRIRCFVTDKEDNKQIRYAIKSQLMWSHYADEHKGVCILYNFEYRPYSILRYAELGKIRKWLKVKYVNDFFCGDSGKESKQTLFATKHLDWKYENEVRLFNYDPTITQKRQHIQIPLEDLGGKIKSIIFGSRCSEKDEQTIRELFKNQDIFFRISGIENLGEDDNVYDLKIDDEEKWRKLTPQ